MTAKELYEQLKAAGLENARLITNPANCDHTEWGYWVETTPVCGWTKIAENGVFLDTED